MTLCCSSSCHLARPFSDFASYSGARFVSIERSILVNQLQIQLKIWATTLQIQKQGEFLCFDDVIVFDVYSINLNE